MNPQPFRADHAPAPSRPGDSARWTGLDLLLAATLVIAVGLAVSTARACPELAWAADRTSAALAAAPPAVPDAGTRGILQYLRAHASGGPARTPARGPADVFPGAPCSVIRVNILLSACGTSWRDW
jgi:hypothetical protein